MTIADYKSDARKWAGRVRESRQIFNAAESKFSVLTDKKGQLMSQSANKLFDNLMTYPEIAEYLEVSLRSARRYAAKGLLGDGVMLGGKVKYNRKAVERLRQIGIRHAKSVS